MCERKPLRNFGRSKLGTPIPDDHKLYNLRNNMQHCYAYALATLDIFSLRQLIKSHSLYYNYNGSNLLRRTVLCKHKENVILNNKNIHYII